jgi:hypothetical protein
MNNKLTDQIISITNSLSKEEQQAFRRGAKESVLYLQLFGVFEKHCTSPGSDIDKEIEREAKNIKGELNNLKENLLKKLIEFVRKTEEEKNREYFEIKNSLESVTALMNRGQFELANELIGKNYKKLKKIKTNGTNYHLFLQYLNQVLEIRTMRYDKDTQSLPTDFNSNETIEWLNRLTKNAAGYIVASTESVSEDFRSNLFFHLLNDYLLMKNNYRELDRNLNNSGGYHLDFILGRHRNKSSDEDTLVSFRILIDLFRLQTAIKLNDPQEIGFVLDSIENHSFHFKDKNYQVFVFLMLQVFDFRLNVALDTKQFPLFEKTNLVFDIKEKDLKLFTDKEIEGVGLRIEMNKGLILLLTEQYEKANKHFSAIPIIEGTSSEHKFYLKLFESISYCPLHPDIFQFKVYDKGLDYIENMKFRGSIYSKAFLKLLLENRDRKNLTKLGKEFSEKHYPTSTSDKVLHHWLIQLQPKR